MASNINRVLVSGRLTRDAELRSTQGGTSVLTFGIAVNDRRRNPQTGEFEDVPNFISCVIFGNRGPALAQYLTKGQKVALEGKLRWSQWEKDGAKRDKIEVVVDEVELLSGGQQNAPQGAPQPQYAPQQRQMYANPPQQQMAPQMAPQPPVAQYGGYQPTVQPPAPVQQDMYASEDIPF